MSEHVKRLPVQFGSADSANFELSTWTFEMEAGYRVAAGPFAILPRDQFEALRAVRIELLAVLKTIVRVADGRTVSGNLILDENSPLMGAARDVIAKATGAAS